MEAVALLNRLGVWLVGHLWMLSLELAVLAGAIFAAIRLLRVRSPRMRHLFWSLVLAKPVVTFLVASPISLYVFLRPLPAPPAPAPVVLQAPAVVDRHVRPEMPVGGWPRPTPRVPVAVETAPWWEGFTAHGAAAAVWLVVATALALRLVVGFAFVSFLRHTATVQRQGPLADLVADASRALRTRRRVPVALSRVVHGPVLAGVLRPCIILPEGLASELPADRLRMIVAHELAHARRFDNLALLVQRLAEVVLFFHPAVWICGWVMRREAEAACDDAVISAFGRSAEYADSLARVAEIRTGLTRKLLINTFAAAESNYSARVRRILRGRSGRAKFRLTALAMLALALMALIGLPRAAARRTEEGASGPGGPGAEEAAMSEDTEVEYGFRHDPIGWVESDRSVQGAMVRTFVFERPREGDGDLIEAEIGKTLGAQLPDGRLSDDADHSFQFTAEALIRLAEMGCAADRPEVGKAVAAILGKDEPNQADPLGIYDVRALCLLGLAGEPRYREVVRDGLRRCVEAEDEWGDIWEGCPWTPIEHLITLWHGREEADTEALVLRWVKRIGENVNAAGCWSYKDPWGFVRLASEVDGPEARALLVKEVPVILRGQQGDGGWGERSFVVLRALKRHGLLDGLRELPALPADWRVVRTVPAPAGDCSTLAWDGGLLWTFSAATNEATGFSPDDGRVARRVTLPVQGVSGISRWDDDLAVAQTDPKRLLKVSRETGQVETVVELAMMEWINGLTQIGDRFMVGDGFLGVGVIVDPSDPATPEHRVLGGPMPVDLAADGEAVWHVDAWAPALMKSDATRNGRLLDWGEKPFGDVAGIAWDGEHLWAADNGGKRICMLEKTETGRALTAKNASAGSGREASGPKAAGRATPDRAKLDALARQSHHPQDPFSLTVQAAAAAFGIEADYEEVYALSTNCFAPDIRPDEECRITWRMRGRGQCMDLVADALGLAVRPIGCFVPREYGRRDDRSWEQKAREAAAAVREALANGEVVVTDAGWLADFMLWGIVTEVRDEQGMVGVTPNRRTDNTFAYVSSFWALSPKGSRADQRDVDLRMVRRAVARIRASEDPFLPGSAACGLPAIGGPAVPGAVLWGLPAMDRWIEQMEQVPYQQDDAASSVGNARLCTWHTLHGAEVAREQLAACAGRLGGEAGRRLRAAAGRYARIAELLWPAVTGEGGETYEAIMGDAAKQKAHADTLRQVKAELVAAGGELEAALRAEGVEAAASGRVGSGGDDGPEAGAEAWEGTRVEIEGVPARDLGIGWDMLLRGLQVLLEHRGVEAELPELMALSGDAFNLCHASHWQDIAYLCAPTDTLANAGVAYGFGHEWLSSSVYSHEMTGLPLAERERRTGQILERIHGELSAGRPVLVGGSGDGGCPYWAVVVGYDGDGPSLCHIGDGEPYTWMGVRGLASDLSPAAGRSGYWNGRVRGAIEPGFVGMWRNNPAFVLGDRGEPPAGRERVLAALQRAVEVHRAPRHHIDYWGGVDYYFGEEAYARWAEALAELDYPADLDGPRPEDAYDWYRMGNIDTQVDQVVRGRSAAAEFCESAAAVLAESAGDLRAAARHYREQVAIARDAFRVFIPPHDGNDGARVAWLSSERAREEGAAAVRRMLESERAAVARIERVLAAEGIVVAPVPAPVPAGRAASKDEVARLGQWGNIFGGDEERLLAGAERYPEIRDLLQLEASLEPISDEARAVRVYMSGLEPAEWDYTDQLDDALAAIGGGTPPAGRDEKVRERLAYVEKRRQALLLWLSGTPEPEAEESEETDVDSVRLTYSVLGAPDAEKRRLAQMVADKLGPDDVKREDLESLEESAELAPFAHRIDMHGYQLWSFDRNHELLLRSIAQKRALGEWHKPGGPLAWGDGHPDDRPRVEAMLRRVRSWLDATPDAELGAPDDYREKVWLARCLTVYLRDHLANYYNWYRDEAMAANVQREDGRTWIESLERFPSWMTQPGGYVACSRYLGMEHSPAWLYGGSAFAFALNVHRVLCPSGPTAWRDQECNRLARGLGLEIEALLAFAGEENAARKREAHFERARQALEAGLPIIGWEMDIPDYYVVCGYDAEGNYLFRDFDDSIRRIHHSKLGDTGIGAHYLMIVRPGEAAEDSTVVRQALEFALQVAAGGHGHGGEYATGLAGYDRWIQALARPEAVLAGEHSGRGMAYNAACWAECRRHAADFLKEARERLGAESLDGDLARAIEHYGTVAARLGEVPKLFPMDPAQGEAMRERLHDASRRARAIEALRAARDAEGKGLRVLARVALALGSEPSLAAALEETLASVGDDFQNDGGGAPANVRREGGKVWIEGLEEMNSDSTYFTRRDSFMGCMTEILRCAGMDVTYAELMGLSGQAFKLTMMENCHPGATQGHVGTAAYAPDGTPLSTRLVWGPDDSPMNFHANAMRVFGLEWDHLEPLDDEKDPDWRAKMVEFGKRTIDRGIPFLYMDGEWNLIVGYREDGSAFICKLYDDGEPGYKEMAKPRGTIGDVWWATVAVPTGRVVPRRQAVIESLRTAAILWRTEAFGDGDIHCGRAGYDAWMQVLADPPEDVMLHGNAFCYSSLLTSRRAAAEYLRMVADGLGGEAAGHLVEAADRYDAVAARLDAGKECVSWPWDEKWTPENRAEQADILRACQADEAAAVGEIEAALAALGESVPEPPLS
jgi:beta-lactamase regulating signal transducer with metallopeptidase domain